jgi:peptidoglycan hydrolase-like protein with peptidoglycan-binding domain
MRNNRVFSLALLASLFLAFFALAQSAQSSCPNLSHNLFFRSGGSDVIALQNFLIAQTLLPQSDNTGYFGRLTKAAAIQFQTQQSLPSTGFVGPLTRAAIARVCGGGQTQQLIQNQTTASNLNTYTTTSNTSGSAVSLTAMSPAQGFYGDGFAICGIGFDFAGQSWGGKADVYMGTTLIQKNTAFIPGGGCGLNGFIIPATVPQLAPGTYPVTVINSGVTSNSLNFTVESGMPTNCTPPPTACEVGYKPAWDNSNDGKGCSLRSSCVPIGSPPATTNAAPSAQ